MACRNRRVNRGSCLELRGFLNFRVETLRVGTFVADRALAGLALVTAGLLLVRLWLDAHLELMFDEAYYALWAKHLAWSYFDHPPMVALWIRLSTILFGEHEFGVRALGTLAATAEQDSSISFPGICSAIERPRSSLRFCTAQCC